jgi:hypothetical protein
MLLQFSMWTSTTFCTVITNKKLHFIDSVESDTICSLNAKIKADACFNSFSFSDKVW